MDLPKLDFAREVRGGRCPHDGYQRGAGLNYYGLPPIIEQQQDYIDAVTMVSGRSIVRLPRLMNLYLLIRFYLPALAPGHILEFGSYRGGSAMFMAKLAQTWLPGTQVYALDTFAGMPVTDKSIDAHNAGDFADANIEEIRAAADSFGLDNLHLVKGLFDETTPGVIDQCKTISLAHIDCDIYHPAVYVWDQIKPAMVPGGYVVFDDATESTCLGATEAVEKIIQKDGLFSEQIYPHYVFRYPPLA